VTCSASGDGRSWLVLLVLVVDRSGSGEKISICIY
jgi:hypothetical protein